MSKVVALFDGLRNAITGAGTGRDARMASAYVTRPLTQQEISAAYSGSGLMRKIIGIPALDMVREWRDWRLPADDVNLIEAEERRLGIQQKILSAETLRGLGGGALILGLPGQTDQPAPKTVSKGGLAFVHVVSRWHLTFDKIEEDARLPGYGEPRMWSMSSGTGTPVKLHPSRVIPFRADTSATLAAAMTGMSNQDAFWGECRVAQVLDAVKDSDSARAAFAALLHKARLTRIGIPGLTDLVSAPGGEAKITARIQIMQLAESMHNVTVYDTGAGDKNGEQIDDITYSFAGAKDVLNAYAEFACAISDIPATRLLGRAPEGMNSSGDSQQADWRKKVRAMQTLELAPCLHRLDAFLAASALGKTPDATCWYDFAPLDTPTEKETADRVKALVDAADKLASMNVMPERAFNRGIQSWLIEEGVFPDLEGALSEIPDDERYGIEPVATDPATVTGQAKGGDPASTGVGGAGLEALPPRRAANDAAPRTLYVSRKLINAQELIAWAKAQGFETTLPADELHVTIAYSRQPVDWMKAGQTWDNGDDGRLTVSPGGARIVEPLGDKGAVVLLFASSALSWRHEEIKREAGATWDFPEFQPHVSITYAGSDVDLSKVEPFRGKLIFGPEIFAEVDDGWADRVEEEE